MNGDNGEVLWLLVIFFVMIVWGIVEFICWMFSFVHITLG